MCRRLCHPDDVDHKIADCREKCTRMIKDCGHACQRDCSAVCGGCSVPSSVALECGHVVAVSCARAVAIRDGRESMPLCKALVDNVRPKCGHMQRMTCIDARAVPLRCGVRCDGVLACGHKCTSMCVDCRAASPNQHASVCQHPCERTLMCGHTCKATPCHVGGSCPPCEQACNVRCEHSLCALTCRRPCASCVQACGWRCTVQHGDAMLRCEMPCGSPCVRVPCDVRCETMLACGHRCPSLCGEPCVDARFCVECAAAGSPATANTAQQLVDVIVNTTLAELDLNEPGCELLPLRCGHALTRESLDGMCKLRHFYAYDDGKQRWTHALPLHAIDPADVGTSMPVCPLCRAPITGVRRYGRVLNWFTLVSIQRKWQIDTQVCKNLIHFDCRTFL